MKAFLNEQCIRNGGQTIEWEKIQRPFQENWRYKGNTSCKDGHNKNRNSKDLKEAEDTKKRERIHRRTVQKMS